MDRFEKPPKEKLITSIFNHIHALPYYEIQRSIILVSFTEDHAFVFQKITGRSRQASEKYPFAYKLEDGTRIIDATINFLKPELQLNFVTMHYVMNLVEQAKFIFVFNSVDTSSMPFQIIKQTLIRFISMFRPLQGLQLDQLIRSCGIIINDANSDCSVETYCQRLLGIRQQGFLEKKYDNIKRLAEDILDKKRILLSFCGKKSKIPMKDFLQFANKLAFFKMEGRVKFNLASNYKSFVEQKIYETWKQVFTKLYSSIDSIIMGNGPQIQKEIYQQLKNFDKRSMNENKKLNEFNKQTFKSLQIMRALDAMTQLVIQFSHYKVVYDFKQNKQFLASFLDFLHSQQLLNNLFIKQFIMSYFVIHKLLANKDHPDDPKSDAFHRVDFCDSIRTSATFNPKMRAISLQLLCHLQKDLEGGNKDYPFQQSLDLLDRLLKYKDNPLFSFFTDRIFKKLVKERANIAYQLMRHSSKNKKQLLKNSINFIKLSCQCKLIKDKLKIQVLINIALGLAQNESTIDLALEVFGLLPEYQVCKQVRYIYQKQLSINAQLLQYIPKEKRDAILSKYFENYYVFLLKIGFEETVRQLTMECLRLEENEEKRNYFKNALVKARGNTSRDLHKSFLQSSVIEEKEIIIPIHFIDQVKEKMLEIKLIEQ